MSVPVRLDTLLWGVNLDQHGTPQLAFIPTGMQVALHKRMREALGKASDHAHYQAAAVLLGRRVTTFRRIRIFEFQALKTALAEQTSDHPGMPYGEGEY
jgi:hypothetical protein